MFRFALLPLLILPMLARAQDETYGKSEAQLLAMGQDKWDAFYQAKEGPSTASMARMNKIFGEAAKHRNDRILKQATPASRDRVLRLRKLMTAFANHAVDIADNVVGGGTMWIPVYANIEADTEMALYGVLGGKVVKSRPATVSSVKNRITDVGNVIEKTHADHDADSYFKYPDAKISLAGLRSDLNQIAQIAKHLDRKNSDRVLGFCTNYARTAKDEWN